MTMIYSQAIDDYVRRLVERFRPRAVMLFGSQAKGIATGESDVDLLVIMDHDKQRNVEQEIEIDCSLERSFPLDILVHRTEEFKQRLQSGDMALKTMVENGIFLYGQP
ncbi:MAG: nucleotidyltransferase domain-containing protein [Lentisphaerae bacterium]|nr:nucleotidyltransferase domain-containing protein [Lentisphaerota bacterium]